MKEKSLLDKHHKFKLCLDCVKIEFPQYALKFLIFFVLKKTFCSQSKHCTGQPSWLAISAAASPASPQG